MKKIFHLIPEAKKLRAEGLTHQDIADCLGITKEQAWRLCNWERYKEGERKTNAKRNKAKRQHEKDNRAACIKCGKPKGQGSKAKSKYGTGLCLECHVRKENERTHEKYLTIQRLWKKGLSTKDIAAEINSTPGTIHVLLDRMRKAGYSVPYRHSYPRQRSR